MIEIKLEFDRTRLSWYNILKFLREHKKPAGITSQWEEDIEALKSCGLTVVTRVRRDDAVISAGDSIELHFNSPEEEFLFRLKYGGGWI